MRREESLLANVTRGSSTYARVHLCVYVYICAQATSATANTDDPLTALLLLRRLASEVVPLGHRFGRMLDVISISIIQK